MLSCFDENAHNLASLGAASLRSAPQYYYLRIYAIINFAIVVAVYCRQIFVYFVAIRASRSMFEDLLRSILRAPMSFFDTTPIGRIVNRFSKVSALNSYTTNNPIT